MKFKGIGTADAFFVLRRKIPVSLESGSRNELLLLRRKRIIILIRGDKYGNLSWRKYQAFKAGKRNHSGNPCRVFRGYLPECKQVGARGFPYLKIPH